jgi:hypothetical protein
MYHLNGGKRGLSASEFQQVSSNFCDRKGLDMRLKNMKHHGFIKPKEILLTFRESNLGNNFPSCRNLPIQKKRICKSLRYVIAPKVIGYLEKEGCTSFLDPNYSYFKTVISNAEKNKKRTPYSIDFNMSNLLWQ